MANTGSKRGVLTRTTIVDKSQHPYRPQGHEVLHTDRCSRPLHRLAHSQPSCIRHHLSDGFCVVLVIRVGMRGSSPRWGFARSTPSFAHPSQVDLPWAILGLLGFRHSCLQVLIIAPWQLAPQAPPSACPSMFVSESSCFLDVAPGLPERRGCSTCGLAQQVLRKKWVVNDGILFFLFNMYVNTNMCIYIQILMHIKTSLYMQIIYVYKCIIYVYKCT